MPKQTINIGSSANDGTGDPLRTAFQKINDNFAELYGDDSSADTFTSPQITTPTITGLTTIDNLIFNDSQISTATNANLELNPGGSGTIELQAATNVTGALDVTGAATLDTSLTLASGATVTEFSTNTALGTSNTVVPTQNAVKTYVDAQVTASNLSFAGDTGGTLNIDLDSETLTIAGGTGIDTSGSSDTLTVAIDSSVVTLTGGQTLTNKILTSPTITGATTIDNLTFDDNIIGTASNADLILTPGGTGLVSIPGSLDVLGTTYLYDISSTGTANLTTVIVGNGITVTGDVSTTGNQTVTGNITAQGTVFSDRIKSPATNANLAISAQGTGIVDVQSAMTTIGQTITGTASVTGQLNADNIRIDGNNISATNANGGINISPDGSGVVTVSTTLQANRISAATIIEVDPSTGHIDTNSIRSVSTNADLSISTGPGSGTIDFNTPAQSTVGSAGAASALPATPSGYLKFKLNGTDIVVPYYAAS